MDNNRPLKDNFYEHLNGASKYINKMYDKTTFADNYGSSMVIVIIITVFVFTVFCYCYFMQKQVEIYADWNNNRCKPQYIPIAGFIAAPEGQSIGDYTNENFQYCLNAQATSLSGYALQPVMYMVSALSSIISFILNAINLIRNMFNTMRNNIAEFVKQIMGKILNITTPLITMFIALLDSLQKTQGVMATGIFTLLSVYYGLQSLIGSIFEILGKMLLMMIIIIAICWMLPFTIPTAIGLSAVYVVLAALISILMVTYVLVFGIKVLNIPKLPKHKCFDKNVKINLENGITKNIIDVEAGDILENGTKVTAKMKLDATDVRMFKIKDVIVSETHIVKCGDKWLPVKDCPEAIEIHGYREPYLYCFNTNSKEIILNGVVFTDWDEIYDETLNVVLEAIPFDNYNRDLKSKYKNENVHRYLDVGFDKDIIIDLIGNTNKKIKDINVGDILLSGAKVYGIVEIEMSELANYELALGNNSNNNDNNVNELKLYHLLTSDNAFSSNGQIIPDYNDHIDKITQN